MHRIIQDSIHEDRGQIPQGQVDKQAAEEGMAAYRMAQRTLQST